jgi:exodeoxyribonuclease-3
MLIKNGLTGKVVCGLGFSPLRHYTRAKEKWKGIGEMQIISWNVNGIRAAERKGFLDWLAEVQPDILCVQETKAQPDQLSRKLRQPAGYHSYFHSAERKGYSGVATYSREPLVVQEGFGQPEFDVEGRTLQSEQHGFTLLNCYMPNGGQGPERLDYKYRYYAALLDFCDELHAAGHLLVICGDVNTAHKPIDLARPKENETVSGFLPEERAWVDKYLAHGFVDAFRHFYPDATDQYTWWSYITRARARNVGWRIDYFLVSEGLMPRVKDCTIMPEVMGSDHCPIALEIE